MQRYVSNWWVMGVSALLMCLVAPWVQATKESEPRLEPDVVQADFTELYQRLQASHFDLYARRGKAEYDALFERLRASFTKPLTVPEIQAQFQTFVAYGNVAHARIDSMQSGFGAYRQNGGTALPLAVRVVDGAVYVAENNSGIGAIARGDEVLSLNGKPMAKVLAEMGRHVSADNDYMLHTLVELWFPALVWQQLGPQEQFTLQVRRATAAPFTVVIPARTRPEVIAASNAQPALLELDWDKREAKVLDGGIGYLRPGPFYNNEANATNVWDVAPFATFIDQSFDRFLKDGVSKLIIDLRDNPGGDNSFSDRMVSWFANKPYRFTSKFLIKVSEATTANNRARIGQGGDQLATVADISRDFDQLYRQHKPGDVVTYEMPLAQPRQGKRFTGQVYLLINRRSYSNTVMVAAIAQDYGFAKVIGEETSDLATTYGAMEQFTLSRTGISVGYPKALILRPNGNTDARGVIPDLPIKTPILETPEDPVLQAAVKLVKSAT